MGHKHHHHHKATGKNLFWAILLNVGISLAELIGGLLSGSMSLISDAVHNFSDVISLIISYVANRLSKKAATEKHTFGYKRSEILAAFVNSVTLIVLAVFIIYQAIERYINPVEIKGRPVIYLALLSVVVNALSVKLIEKDAVNNMNMRSAYLHLFGDMMTSVAVLAGGVVMHFFHIYQIDSILSVLIGLYLIRISWEVFRSSLRIIMQFTPEHIDLQKIVKEVCHIEGVKNLHHVHVWQIDEHDIMFEAHIDLSKDVKISDFEQILKQVKECLSEYDIYHVTLQPEFSMPDNKEVIVDN